MGLSLGNQSLENTNLIFKTAWFLAPKKFKKVPESKSYTTSFGQDQSELDSCPCKFHPHNPRQKMCPGVCVCVCFLKFRYVNKHTSYTLGTTIPYLVYMLESENMLCAGIQLVHWRLRLSPEAHCFPSTLVIGEKHTLPFRDP